MAEEYKDKRLVCTHCGERGTLVVRESACWVTCAGNRGGSWCCCTRTYPTQAQAIAAWERHWQEAEGARGANA